MGSKNSKPSADLLLVRPHLPGGIDGPVALADPKAVFDCARDEILGESHGIQDGVAVSKPRCDCSGQRASRSMSVLGVETRPVDLGGGGTVEQDVHGAVARKVPSLHEHGLGSQLVKSP